MTLPLYQPNIRVETQLVRYYLPRDTCPFILGLILFVLLLLGAA